LIYTRVSIEHGLEQEFAVEDIEYGDKRGGLIWNCKPGERLSSRWTTPFDGDARARLRRPHNVNINGNLTGGAHREFGTAGIRF
jgi:hypothetical protein